MKYGLSTYLWPIMVTALLVGTGVRSRGAEVSVQLSNPPDAGFVVFRLFDSANTFGDVRDPVREERLPLDGRIIYLLRGVPPGEYALQVYCDENDNGQLDKNFIGIPREPLGFSNGYRPKGPPSYSKARFQLEDEIAFNVELHRPLGKRGRLGGGVGVLGRSSPYRGDDDGVFRVIPAITYNGERLQWFGPNVQYGLLGTGGLRLAATGRYRLGVYEDGDSEFLEGLGDRDDTFMAGLALHLELPGGVDLSLGYEHDVLNEIGGGEGQLHLDKSFQWGVVRASPSIGINWTSSDLADHDFGVPAAKANDLRAAYAVDDALSVEGGLGTFIEITRNWMAIVSVALEVFGNEVTNSPIVDDDYVFKGFVATTYVF